MSCYETIHSCIGFALLFIAAGCQNTQKPAASSANWDSGTPVTDISPTPPPSYQAAQLAAATPTAQPVADTMVSSTPSAGGTIYVVQRGDTLYKIAREHYGDGKAWQKIAAANPSLNGTMIKPGQKLTLP